MTAQSRDIWFVRSNGGQGSYPVTPEGWRIVYGFLGGMLGSALLAVLLLVWRQNWVWLLVFGAGAVVSGLWFITTARKHTDYSITVAEHQRRKAKGEE